MPFNEQRDTLLGAFEKPVGETDGPQIFELSFDRQDGLVHWERRAKEVAEKLGISFKSATAYQLKMDMPYSEGEKILFLAMSSGADYERLALEVQETYVEISAEARKALKLKYALEALEEIESDVSAELQDDGDFGLSL